MLFDTARKISKFAQRTDSRRGTQDRLCRSAGRLRLGGLTPEIWAIPERQAVDSEVMAQNPHRQVRPIGLHRPNTLGLAEEQLEQVLNELDGERDAQGLPMQRDFIRWPFRQAQVSMTVCFMDGQESTFGVACRNLSSGGVSVLHSAFLHAGTACTLELPHPVNGTQLIEGQVVRCDHRQGMVHEIGIRFNEPIHSPEFVESDGLTDCFSMERVEPDLLQGTLVHVEASTMDQRLVAHFLRETQVRVRPAESAEVAEGLILEGCDLVLCNLHLPDMDGPDLLKKVREQGVKSPWITVTSDGSDEARSRVESSATNAFLAKPFDQAMLLRAVAEYLMFGRDGGARHSTLAPDDPAVALLEAYVGELHAFASTLDESLKAEDLESTRQVCLTLKGNAATFGFGEIGRLAGTAVASIDQAGLGEAMATCRAIIAACQRATVKEEAA